MPKSFLAIVLFLLLGGVAYSQSVILNPIGKDSLGPDAFSYTLTGSAELTDSIELQLELIQIYPDSLHSVYFLKSGFDQNLHPTNSNLQYAGETGLFSVPCGVFNRSDLMVRLVLFRNEEKIHETYFK